MPATSNPLISSALQCTQFPRYSDCHGEDRYFCSMWRSVGFLMSFAVVLEGMTIAAFAILLVGGKQKREQGWGVLTILVTLAAAVQAIGMALMVCEIIQQHKRLANGVSRHIYTRTMNDFSPGGIWIKAGPCAPSPGASRHCVPYVSHWRRWYCPVREATN